MSDDFDNLTFEVAELRRQLSNMVTPVSVDKVKGDQMRMVLGRGKDGKDVLSPWLPSGDRRGPATVRSGYTKGQNGWLLCTGGDPSQGVFLPGGPSNDHQPPDHAAEDKEGDSHDEETYQYRNGKQGGQGGGGGGGSGGSGGGGGGQGGGPDFRKKYTAKGGVWFLQEPAGGGQGEQGQQGSEGSGGSGGSGGAGGGGDDWSNGEETKPKKRQAQKIEGEVMSRLHKEDGWEGRIGKSDGAVRCTAHPKGARLRAGKVYVTVEKGKIAIQGAVAYFEKPPVIKKVPDAVPTDIKTDVA